MENNITSIDNKSIEVIFLNEKKLKTISSILLLLILGVSIYCMVGFDDAKAIEIKKEEKKSSVFVDIKGAVNNPGVYELSSDKKIIDVIELAGGLLEKADTSIINLSKKVKDEMCIIIYTIDEINNYKKELLPSKKIIKEIEERIICPDTTNDGCINLNVEKEQIEDGKININTSSLEELMTLPSIGEAKAKNIIEYRKNNKFEKIEDILNVKGIGNSVFEKIKDNIEI